MEFPGYRNKRVIFSSHSSGMGDATARMPAGPGADVPGLDHKPAALDLGSLLGG